MATYTYTDNTNQTAYAAIREPWENQTSDGFTVTCQDCESGFARFVEMYGVRYLDTHNLNPGYFTDWSCDCYRRDKG